MHYHSNHMWCTRSNWTDGFFAANHQVRLDELLEYDTALPWSERVFDLDWINMVETVEVLNEALYKINKNESPDASEKQLISWSSDECPALKKEVVDWLEENVKPSTDKRRKDQPQGWCIGNEQYRAHGDTSELAIWFLRRRDAMNFIKTWSVHKKPTTYHNYFKDDMRTLIDGKLIPVDEL